jgi:hypothetical protein
VKFNAAALLRDNLYRYQSYAIGLDKGFLSIDEVRDSKTVGPCERPRRRRRVRSEVQDDPHKTHARPDRGQGRGSRTARARCAVRPPIQLGSYIESFARGAFAGIDAGSVPLTAAHPRDSAQLPIGVSTEEREWPACTEHRESAAPSWVMRSLRWPAKACHWVCPSGSSTSSTSATSARRNGRRTSAPGDVSRADTLSRSIRVYLIFADSCGLAADCDQGPALSRLRREESQPPNHRLQWPARRSASTVNRPSGSRHAASPDHRGGHGRGEGYRQGVYRSYAAENARRLRRG